MKYVSTRDVRRGHAVRSAEAIKKGLAPDGGLYMPEVIPTLTKDDIVRLAALPYPRRASYILSLFLDDYDPEDLERYTDAAYGDDRFPGGAAPLFPVGDGIYSLELWHGPTCAFKDMALQLMPRLLSGALVSTGEKKIAHILVATSGDTGKAALEGFRDVDGVRITVFYPEDGVSRMQKMQMTTQEGSNVNVCAVKGNFDDAQTGVKRIFSDPELAEKANDENFFFSSANSINWGRLAPQIVYYVSAYCDLIASGAIAPGGKVDFTVPTGNFGNIFAAHLARKMGLPIGKLICASNSNRVLTDFIESGVYDRRRDFYRTVSPSMDILISSNLERLLYLLGGAETTARLMKELTENGFYRAPDEIMEQIREGFAGYSASEPETLEEIGRSYKTDGYLIDPHSAVAFRCCRRYREEASSATPCVVVSTASPYKFPSDVLRALGEKPTDDPAAAFAALSTLTGTAAPAPLMRTLTLPVRFKDSVVPEDMARAVFG